MFWAGSEVSPNVVSYNCALNVFAKAAKPAAAAEQLSQMRALRVEPTLVSYNTVLSAYSSCGDVDDVLDLLQEMESVRVPPDVVSFNAALHACAAAGEESSTSDDILAAMAERRVLPNLVSFNTLLKLCGERGDTDLARKLLKEMPERHITPDIISYNSDGASENACCRLQTAGDPTPKTALHAASTAGEPEISEGLCADMVSAGIHLDAPSFHNVALAYAKAAAWKRSLDLIPKLREAGVEPTDASYRIAMLAAVATNQVPLIKELLAEDIYRLALTSFGFYCEGWPFTLERAPCRCVEASNPAALEA
eukprot:s6659_g1.t1